MQLFTPLDLCDKISLMNIIDDVKAMQNVTFENTPFNEVDSLVFSLLSYFNWETLLNEKTQLEFAEIDGEKIEVPKHCKERFKNHYRLLKAVLSSNRYKDFCMSDFVNDSDIHTEKQFCAVCFFDTEFAYVAFRGTDATVVGWKEDVNLSFMKEVPAQTHSVQYLEEIAKKYPAHKIITGGHSKGGNLAIYSAVKASDEVKTRITEIYCHDGPGFKKEFCLSDEYLQASKKIKKTVPYSSIVGMLMENPTPYDVIDSKSVSIFQHNPYKWLVENHAFVPKPHLNPNWFYFDESINRWIETLTDEEREKFFDEIFTFFDTAGITEFKSKKENFALIMKNLRKIYSSFRNLGEETKTFLGKTIRKLLSILSEERKNNDKKDDDKK